MPLYIEDVQGRPITAYTQAERDFYVGSFGKPAANFLEAPSWVTDLLGTPAPIYKYLSQLPPPPQPGKTVAEVWWADRFTAPSGRTRKPMFDEIFTHSRGPLTTAEINAEIERTGIRINQSYALRAYNDDLETKHDLYLEDYSYEELAKIVSPEAMARIEMVDYWVERVTEARPVYFGFRAVKGVDEGVLEIDGVDHVTNVVGQRVDTIGVAFPGPHCLVRDVFLRGIGVNQDPGFHAPNVPGRDRWARILGAGGFAAWLLSPVLALTRVQMKQIQQGRRVTMPLSNQLPPEMLRWATGGN